jgi:Flp pilus assembly protein CpaB
MKSKTFVMMFLAIGCGLVAAYLTARISAKQATPDTQPVLVAKEKINAGQVIKDPEKVFVLMQYPTGSTPNAISNLEDLKNKIVNKTVQPGQWLTPDDLSGNFGIELPKGYYAMAIKVDAEKGGGGFILPKSRVNVVATIKPTGMNSKPKVVTILQDVLVLAVDNMYIRPDDKMAVPQLNTALLAVKPADSQKLTLAQSMGDLRLVLRSHDDDNRAVLPELEYAGPDTLAGDDSPFAPSGKPAERPKVKLAVAKQDLEPGTVIDNPDTFFTVKPFADAPEGAVSADDIKALKGKTIRHSLFKDAVLTAKYFAGNEAPPVAIKAVENRSLMFIQNGGQAPQMFSYKDGVIEQPENESKDKDKKAGGPATGPATVETGTR